MDRRPRPRRWESPVNAVAVLDDEAVSVSICQVQGQLRLGPQLSASGSVASLKCHDPLAEAAISCGEARGAVETGEVTVVTLSCPQIQLNTTEIFLLRCKCLGAGCHW
eukprot:Skav213080  [mRNA]  locus=scaffold3042:217211:218402:- [translate_table: standard]